MEQRWVHRFEIKPGRWVYHPTEDAIMRGREIKARISKAWRPPSYFFHLRQGGHLAALRFHAGSEFFLRADIQNFFGCVSRSKVTRSLVSIFGYQDARAIALDSTVRVAGTQFPHLPYGFVQSPLLASLALHKSALGTVIQRISRHLKVSVYVDDVIVSGADVEILQTARQELIHAANRSGFPFGSEKIEGPADGVTAFNIRLSRSHMELIPERLQQFYDALRDSDSELEKLGIIHYIDSVNPDQAALLSVLDLSQSVS